MSKDIYLQTLPSCILYDNARMTPQKQIFNAFQFKPIWLNEPRMFILHSAQKMTNSFSASTTWVSCRWLSGACTARGVIKNFGEKYLPALKFYDSSVLHEKSLFLYTRQYIYVISVNTLLLFAQPMYHLLLQNKYYVILVLTSKEWSQLNPECFACLLLVVVLHSVYKYNISKLLTEL